MAVEPQLIHVPRLIDAQGRSFRNLRVSLTAACNYACTYCVPKGKQLHRARHELSVQQFLTALDYLIEVAGIDKLRITGGEPLLSPQFDDFLRGAMQRPLKDVSITTNGQFLLQKMPVIKEAGIQRMNVSLDTLNPVMFQKICRSGDLHTVLAGIDALLDAGIKVKINMVPMRTQNEDQIVPLLDYCINRGIELRFIELMRMGHWQNNADYSRELVAMNRILELISRRYDYLRTAAEFDATAARFEIPGKGFFGIIANESLPFCSTCSRLRLSSAGFLHGCLSNTARHHIADLLDLPREEALPLLRTHLHGALLDKQPVAFSGSETVMRWIGG
ncbi:MAG TPA: radical SAM protein [Pseudomonadales bacterium]|nr:radical SAM protein [Pseudomonadales bacterium]